jgi:hypothetical protein
LDDQRHVALEHEIRRRPMAGTGRSQDRREIAATVAVDEVIAHREALGVDQRCRIEDGRRGAEDHEGVEMLVGAELVHAAAPPLHLIG